MPARPRALATCSARREKRLWGAGERSRTDRRWPVWTAGCPASSWSPSSRITGQKGARSWAGPKSWVRLAGRLHVAVDRRPFHLSGRRAAGAIGRGSARQDSAGRHGQRRHQAGRESLAAGPQPAPRRCRCSAPVGRRSRPVGGLARLPADRQADDHHQGPAERGARTGGAAGPGAAARAVRNASGPGAAAVEDRLATGSGHQRVPGPFQPRRLFDSQRAGLRFRGGGDRHRRFLPRRANRAIPRPRRAGRR